MSSLIATAITGEENVTTLKTDALVILNQFYHAFNHQDLKLMSNNWLQTEEASMSNPLGGVKRSWESIREVYDRIFNGTASVYVEFYDFTIHQCDEMFIAVGRERGYFKKESLKIDLSIRTSRTFVKKEGQWLQIHHHGSIDNPSLLEQYQKAVIAQ